MATSASVPVSRVLGRGIPSSSRATSPSPAMDMVLLIKICLRWELKETHDSAFGSGVAGKCTGLYLICHISSILGMGC